MTDARKPVDRVERLEEELALVRAAQKKYAEFTQEQVDRIFFAAAMAAGKMRLPLAKMAVEETGMGVVEDKVIKNHFASEYIYNAYRDVKTCGVIEEDKAYGITRCYYGHLHGNAIRYAVQGDVDGIRYKLVSADGLRFCPYRIN